MALWGDDAWGGGAWGDIVTIAPGLLDASGVLFYLQIPLDFPLINQSPVLFAPKPSPRIAVGLIDQSPVIYAFGGVPQTVDLSEPFQRDTFQVV